MKASQKTLATVIGGAFVMSVAATAVHAAENPFVMKTLSAGYMVAEADMPAEKAKDGKCSTGKCSATKKHEMEEKAKAAGDKDKAKDGSCSADKAKEASCKADKK
ncbi:MAG: hypothetical protein ACAH12_08930 [Methylophilaceae bacterium]